MKKTKSTRWIFTFFLIILILIAIPTFVNILFSGFQQFSSMNIYFRKVSFGFFAGLAFWLGNTGIFTLLGRKLNWKKEPQKANLIILLSTLLLGVAISLLLPFIFERYVFGLSGKSLRYAVVSNGFICLSIDLIVVSFFYSQYLVNYWIKSIKNEEELKRENLIAKYEALKNQVNPHFLFNTLNTLSGVVEQKPDRATEFIKKLSDIYRYVLEQTDKETISIDQEVKFINDYMYLAKIRHEDSLNLKVEVDVNLHIIPLGLQMLVENAIKHNIISDDCPLTIEIKNDEHFIIVKNNLQKKTISGAKSLLGLENLKNRYIYLSDKSVEIMETDSNFIVKLPIIQP